MTPENFISWLEGYLEGVSYDAQKPNPVIQTILDKIESVKAISLGDESTPAGWTITYGGVSGTSTTTTSDPFSDKQILKG